MARTLRLFVYGTLQPQVGTAMGAWLARRLVCRDGKPAMEAAQAEGRLHAIANRDGWYPALVPGRGQVSGTLCILALGPGDLKALDAYEGPQYRRVRLAVRTPFGRHGEAQTYIWQAALPCGAPVIPGGDFLDWLNKRRRSAFGGT